MARGLGLRHVEVVYAVMLTGTITGAAARLNVSQPAISNCVKEAEERLGFPLFTRQHGRVFPTERATAIFSEIERSFTGLDTINSLRSEEHTSELQSRENLVCRLLLEKK